MTNASSAQAYAQLSPGDPMPHCKQRTLSRPVFVLDSMAGRYLVFCFFGSAARPEAQKALQLAATHQMIFDNRSVCFFGISADPTDEVQGRLREIPPGIRMVCDMDGSVSRTFGALPIAWQPGQGAEYRAFWLVVDPSLHVLARFEFSEEAHPVLLKLLTQLPPPSAFAGFELPPPILILPIVFEPGLCRNLIELYEKETRDETGVMRDGVGVIDRTFKSRRDCEVDDSALLKAIHERINRKVLPEIRRVFFSKITRIERCIVGCYAADENGHFRPHRDNSELVTAHRRFAISINLNDDFEGGAVSFPEYSARGFKVPTGWAVVFPCNLLHMVSAVTAGRRYAFLPFVYDEEGARIRSENAAEAARQTTSRSETL
jgi:hypothetical protein